MSGKYSRSITPGLSAGCAVLTFQADIQNTSASSFSTVCNSDNYYLQFRGIKKNAETVPFNVTPRVFEAYDAIFAIDALLAALDRCCRISSGLYGIHNEMLSQLPLEIK
jgi:hypothetical protein